MYPHERSLVKRMANKPFALLGVNSDGDRDSIRKIVKEKNLTWRSWWDGPPNGAIASAWNVRSWPTIFVLDHEGVIRHKNLRGDNLDKAIDELVAKAEAAGSAQ